MKTHTLAKRTATLIAVLLLSVVLPSSVMAQKGKGGNGGGGGGGTAGSPDLGDIFVLYRDADGIPILTLDSCQQPLAAPGIALPAIGTYPGCTPSSPTASCIVPVDPATCAVATGYETYTQEVDFGRTSVIRSPVSVLTTQLEEAVVRLATADCVTLDPAGRMVTSTVTSDVVTSAAIDSPLQNLALYYQLMLTGYLGSATAPLPLPASPLDTAARGLGAAADKTGAINVDMVVYINQILGLTDEAVPTFLPKKCITVKEEVKGVVQMVRKCFLDYGPTGGNYAYSRGANFAALPSPAYIPVAGPQAGWLEYLAVLDPTPTFYIANGATLAAVPTLLSAPGFVGANIGGFAVAADDARAVIDFMHTWPIPGDYAAPLACTASGATQYDVSISADSGLQVPVRMVAGTEGREFTVSVANAGPDTAVGVVELTATDSNGAAVPTFPRSFPFTILPGASQSWTEGFAVSYATTVTWRATATAPLDVNLGNNVVTETTQVIGGGGGRR